jgi:flagellar M-ring protein FliF
VNFEQFFTRIKHATAALSGGQVVSLALAFLAVVGITIGSAYYLNTPSYGVLFSDLDSDSASAIVGKLKTDKVQYSLEDGGRTVRVPAGRVDDLRLQYASAGLTGGSHVGFELFDRSAFGVTDFQEHVNYRRALEGELARTISSISEVAGARVHIAMPQPSLFAGREQPTKASVILKLRGNRQLQASTVSAITNLVSASVESLRPEAVVVIDNFGRPLSKPQTEEEAAEGVPLERQQRIERDLTTKVVSLLEPVIGMGRVRVNVSARLSTHTQEETAELWDPTPVIRSRQTVSQSAPGAVGMPAAGLAAAQGVAGTRSNLPDEAAATPAAAPSPTPMAVNGSLSDTANYELSKTVRHTVQPRGDIEKLSVAVLLDEGHQTAEDGTTQIKARAPEEIQKIHGLVAAAIGFDADRGDQLTVENIAFEETPVEEVVAPGAWQKYGPQAMDALRIFAIVGLAAFALFGVVRPMMRGVGAGTALTPSARRVVAAATAASAAGAPRTVQDIEAEMDAQLEGAEAARLPVLTRRMAALTQKEPENAARLLRSWLTEER